MRVEGDLLSFGRDHLEELADLADGPVDDFLFDGQRLDALEHFLEVLVDDHGVFCVAQQLEHVLVGQKVEAGELGPALFEQVAQCALDFV